MAQDLDQAVIVAIGGNLAGDRPSVMALLDEALAALPAAGAMLAARSRWWRSAAWPDPAEPSFLNAVAVVSTGLPPADLLAALRRVELAFGRRAGRANAPRTVDLDLIAYGRRSLDIPEIRIPHPRAHERLFVMGPLAEIAPGWRHPLTGETAARLARRATVGRDAVPLV